MSADLAYLGLAEAAERIRRRALSPVELTSTLIDRCSATLVRRSKTSGCRRYRCGTHRPASSSLPRPMRYTSAGCASARPRAAAAGALLRAADYIQAQRERSRLTRLLAEAMRGLDALVTVSSCDPAARLDDDAELARTYERQARMPFNLTGYPALVIPAGFTRDLHLPLSVQIVGHPFEEAMAYRIAQVYESAAGWVQQHPPLDV